MHSYMLIIFTNFNPISTHTSRLFTATAAHVNTCLELVYSYCKPQEALASHRDFSQKLPFKVFLPIEYYQSSLYPRHCEIISIAENVRSLEALRQICSHCSDFTVDLPDHFLSKLCSTSLFYPIVQQPMSEHN